MATTIASKLRTPKKTENPSRLSKAASRTIATRRPRRSASAPHRYGANRRINCICDINKPMSQAEKLNDWR